MLELADRIGLLDSNRRFHNEIRSLVTQRNYPCVAAVQSVLRKEYDLDVYRNFGSGDDAPRLGQALENFLAKQQATRSTLLSLFAVFPDSHCATEDEFESRLWSELSQLSGRDPSPNWDPRFSSNPEDKNFCFSYAGFAFFVVGLHPKSSRQARRFSCPTLIFNVYEQFLDLAAAGAYLPMIEKNRARDIKFQGSVNPMVERHGDNWEAIQFSGKENSEIWKCPFHRALRSLKSFI